MENNKRYRIKNILLAILWTALGSSTLLMLVAGIRKIDAKLCKGVEIGIKGVNNNFFVDNADIMKSIIAIANGNPVGKSVGSLNMRKMEMELRKNIWIKSAELYLDNNEILQVTVNEREPIARVFSTSGTTFYIDNEISILPLSEKFSARLPVFTNFPAGNAMLTGSDSILLNDIKVISLAIQKDSFRLAIIDQIDITPQRRFEMMPRIGNQLIVFGDATDAEGKFKKLQLFYKEVMVKAGWNNYSVIDLQYKNQVVAKRKGAMDIKADSLRTLQLMQLIAANAEKMAGDSLQIMLQDNDHNATDSLMILQSLQRDDISDSANTGSSGSFKNDQLNVKPVLNSNNLTAQKNAVKQDPIPFQKPRSVLAGKKNSGIKKPKAAMPKPKNNDY